MGIMTWDKLNPNLKSSNFKQVEFMEHTIRSAGLDIRKSSKPDLFKIPVELKENSISELLAMLEHARWNAERLLAGWRYGKTEDIINKLNPYLLPWHELDKKIKDYNYDIVKEFAEHLSLIGYEIFNPG
jgi:hypothetical protein